MQFPTPPTPGDCFQSSTGVEYTFDDTKKVWTKKVWTKKVWTKKVPTPDLTVDTTGTTIAVKKIWTGTKVECNSIDPKLDYSKSIFFIY